MRLISLVLLMGCSAEVLNTWEPEPAWTNDTVVSWETLVEGLDEPRGIVALDNGGWAVAERGAGRVIRIDEVGSMEVLVDGLIGPWGLAEVASDVLLVSDRDGGQVLLIEGDMVTTIEDGLIAPTEILMSGAEGYFIDEEAGELWSTDLSEGTLLASNLDTPTGLSAAAGRVYIAESGSADRVSVWDDSSDSIVVNYFVGVDVPHDVVATPTAVYFTGRSLRWPYGGWMYGGPSTPTTLCESTPGADRVALDGDTLVWSTYESILSCSADGSPFTMVAPETSVGDLVARDGVVVWTDKQRGAVYRR